MERSSTNPIHAKTTFFRTPFRSWRKLRGLCAFLLLSLVLQTGSAFPSGAPPSPPPADCNNPFAGRNYVVDRINNGIVGLLTSGDYSNLVDTSLLNYVQLNTALLAPGASIADVKRVDGSFPSGRRVGFVIEAQSGILSGSVLNRLRLRTYLNNTVQQTDSIGGGIALQLLGGSGGKQRVAFTSSLPFDEVELSVGGVALGVGGLRVYYAFEEDPACDANCITPLTVTNYPSATATTGCIGVLCSDFNNPSRVVDASLSNFADKTYVVGGNAFIDVFIGSTIPAGSDVGFIIERVGVLGVLDLGILGGITLTTYNSSTTALDSVVASASLANVGLLASGQSSISIRTTAAFNRVRIRIQELTLASTFRVYYGFMRPDSDLDNMYDCMDKCVGNDHILNQYGLPLACNANCNINAGLDLTVCPGIGTAQLLAAGPGQSWSALGSNPAVTSINSSGTVTGLSVEGIYGYRLAGGGCADTVYISHLESTLSPTCNNPIAGRGVIADQVGLTGGVCLLCSGGGAANVVDGNLNNYAQYTPAVTLLAESSLVSVRDTGHVYTAPRRVGFVISVGGALLNASVLSNFRIRTYLNNVPQQVATVGNGLLGAGVLSTSGASRQRLSFVTTLPFDEVELTTVNILGLITYVRVYYAFEEPTSGCPDLSDGTLCAEILYTANTTHTGSVSYPNTGISGVVCALCQVNNLGNLVDNNPSNFAQVNLSASLANEAAISIRSKQVVPAGYTAGFVLSGGTNLLNLGILGGIRLRTYLNGSLRNDYLASNGLVNASLLDTSGTGRLAFVTTLSFDEIRISFDALVSSSLSSVNVYYAFVVADADGDGSPDCADKCCGGDDGVDSNGDGVPDACDGLPIALDDTASPNEDTPLQIAVLANDNFVDAPSVGPIYLVSAPLHGTALIDTNTSAANPLDDSILYTPAANYSGPDSLSYAICDAQGDCDTAKVRITVVPVNDKPTAGDDAYITAEDTPVSANVVSNDTDIDGPSVQVSLIDDVDHGNLALNSSGAFTYTPAANYYGVDTFVYRYSDGGSPVLYDTAVAVITINSVNDAPLAANDLGSLAQDSSLRIQVLINDSDIDNALDSNNLVLVSGPAHGTASPQAGGYFLYTPAAYYAGADTFRYAVCDQGMPVLCDTATVALSISPSSIRLALRMRLQAALFGAASDTIMRDTLRVLGLIPVTEPYTATPGFVHHKLGGGETVINPAGVFANHGNQSIADWVFLELRDASRNDSVIATRSALLQRDGDVVDLDGTSPVLFNAVYPASYYVAIRHRNHLGVMTEAPLNLGYASHYLDFSDTLTALWDEGPLYNGIEQARVGTRNALRAGNANADRRIVFAGQANDRNRVFDEVNTAPGNLLHSESYIYQGYHRGDVDLRGSTIYAGQQNDVNHIFNAVDAHPRNIIKSQSFIIREQLP